MENNLIAFLIAVLVVYFFSRGYIKKMRESGKRVRQALDDGSSSAKPQAQHPLIDAMQCIGCGTCTTVCPEGDVLGMLGGRAVIVHPQRCIGHGMCAEACPVGAITMVMATASVGAELPYLTPEGETTVPNLFIAGELGGLALIKNAVAQGRSSIDVITRRLADGAAKGDDASLLDVVIIGAGPAGIAASLRAIENGLSYLTIERDQIGGTVSKYPRQKLVMTSPVEFPMYGKFRKTELSKEELIAFWQKVMARADFKCRAGEAVENIQRGPDGVFTVVTAQGQYKSRAVIMSLGRAGTPKKLGVKGEDLSKVMYRLIEADHYTNNKILVVGGGDSAVEAAMGLANQPGNEVTLSYRKEKFSRIKERNAKRVDEAAKKGKLTLLFNSIPTEITETAVKIEVAGDVREIPNDFVWIFAGGTPPNDFLKKVGVGFGEQKPEVEVAEATQQLVAANASNSGARASDGVSAA